MIKLKTITRCALLSSLSFLLTYIKFALFPQAPFLKLDFSIFPAIFSSARLGRFSGIFVLLTRLILVLFLKPFTIGHIANLTLDLCFLLPLILFLPKIKNSARLIFAIFMSALIFIASGAFLNLRVFCPLYGINKSAALKLIWHFMTPLNAVKSAAYGVFSFFVLKNNKHNI